MVAAGHAFAILAPLTWEANAITVLIHFCNGRAAVTIFFVLSGMVLGMSLRRDKGNFGSNVIQFCFRRGMRIYPAFFLCSLVIVIYLRWFFTNWTYPVHGWFEDFFGAYHRPFTLTQIFRNFTFNSSSLNGVAWSAAGGTHLLRVASVDALDRAPVDAAPERAFAGRLGGGWHVLGGHGRIRVMFFAGYLLPTASSWVRSRAPATRMSA